MSQTSQNFYWSRMIWINVEKLPWLLRTQWGIERMDYKLVALYLKGRHLRSGGMKIRSELDWCKVRLKSRRFFLGIWDILNLWFISIKPHSLWLSCVFISVLFAFNPRSYWKSCDAWSKQWILVWSNSAGSIELTSEFLCPMTFPKLLVGFLFAASPHFITLIYRVINLTGLDQNRRYFSRTGLWEDAGMHWIPDGRLGDIDTFDHHQREGEWRILSRFSWRSGRMERRFSVPGALRQRRGHHLLREMRAQILLLQHRSSAGPGHMW